MSSKKILVVDDLILGLAQMKSLFSRARCSVITASNGKEALENIRNESPDLVLMDLYMPEMNGDECCRIVKGDDSLRDIPFIIFTVSRDENDRIRCIQAGCDDYLTKPIIDTDAFLKSVRKYIDLPVRNHVRVSIDAEISYMHEGKGYSGRLQNISYSGGFIETKTPLPTGSIINLSFMIPNSSNRVEAFGEVIRSVIRDAGIPSTRFVQGIGIMFLGITWAGKKIIDDYVKARERKRMTVA